MRFEPEPTQPVFDALRMMPDPPLALHVMVLVLRTAALDADGKVTTCSITDNELAAMSGVSADRAAATVDRLCESGILRYVQRPTVRADRVLAFGEVALSAYEAATGEVVERPERG